MSNGPGLASAASTTRYKPYPTYKDSGIEWLGRVPSDWAVQRLKTMGTIRLSNVDKKAVEGDEPVLLCNYVDVYYHDVITQDIDFMSATATREQIRRFSLKAGDVLITKDSESWDDIAVPAVVSHDLPGVLCGYHLALVRANRECVGSYLARVFQAVGPRDQFRVAANGITRFGLGSDAIQSAWFMLPPVWEQAAIVAFLDLQTAKIDALISKNEQLIKLLQDRRTAMITQAVTKGLDPSASMKDSGVDCLEEIPVTWKVKRVKFLVSQPLKYGAGESAEITDPELPRYIRITDIGEDGNLREDTFCSIPEDVARGYLLVEGDILFARSGATVGKSFRYDPSWGRAAYAGYLIRARLDRSQIVSKFLHYFTQSGPYWTWISSNATQSTIPNVNAERYASLWVPVPPLQEQFRIVEHLSSVSTMIDRLVTKAETAIAMLQELRIALISAAVTGQIDVRQEVV